LPVVLAVLPLRRLPGFLARTVAPGAVLLGVALIANASATWHAVTSQPNWPSRNHPTPWTALAPEISGGGVAAGPGRLLALLFACCCAVVVRHRWAATAESERWTAAPFAELLWWVATALAFRCLFESVMVAYYIWPVLAVALVAASAGRRSLVITAAASSLLTFVAQFSWRGPWLWWAMIVLGLSVALAAARPGKSADRAGPGIGARSSAFLDSSR